MTGSIVPKEEMSPVCPARGCEFTPPRADNSVNSRGRAILAISPFREAINRERNIAKTLVVFRNRLNASTDVRHDRKCPEAHGRISMKPRLPAVSPA